VTAKTRTRKVVETEDVCDRFPCDHAYRKHRHQLVDGEVRHRTSVDSGDDWRVEIAAWNDDQPWFVAIDPPGYGISDLEEAARFGHAIATAAVWAAVKT
jgi:hypothetical protein